MNTNPKSRELAILGAIVISFVFEQLAVAAGGPGGPYCPTSCGGWTCISSGSVNNPGMLTKTNETICVGSSVSAPSLTNTTFYNGQKAQPCNNNCGTYWTNSSPITYTATNWWEPPLPATFTNVGTFSFTNKVKGITTDSDCPSPTAITNAGTYIVTVINSLPVIMSQPTDQTVNAGQTATFTVVATGTLPLSYQWYFNTNTPLANATNATLTLTNVQFSQAGTYSVLVTNVVGSTNSTFAVLTVNPPPPCMPATSGLVSWWAAENNALDSKGTNNGSLQSGAGFTNGMVGMAFDLENSSACVKILYSPTLTTSNFTMEAWVKPFTQVANGYNQFWVFGQSYSRQLVLRPGTSGLRVAFQISANGFGFYDVVSTNEIPLNQFSHLAGSWDGTTLKLYINGVLNNTRTPNISAWDSGYPFWIGGPSGDQYFNGLIDEVGCFNRALTTDEITSIYTCGSPVIIVQPTNQAVCSGLAATFCVTVTGSSLNYQWRFNGVDIPGATSNSYTNISVQPTDVGSYSVVVSNSYGSVTSLNAILTLVGMPTIIIQPTNQIECSNGVASFSVQATNSLPLSYQWFTNNVPLVDDGRIVGSTNTTLTINNVQPSDAASYSVTVNNTCGSVDSSNATLTVLIPPFITNKPVSIIVCSNSTTSFSVGAGGYPPPSYQWYFNTYTPLANGTNIRGSIIGGATNSTLYITNVQPSDGGNNSDNNNNTYSVVISNDCGSVTSKPVSLSVDLVFTVTNDVTNESQTIIEGHDAFFFVQTDITNTVHYQWYSNSTPNYSTAKRIAGATQSKLWIPNVRTNLNDTADYSKIHSYYFVLVSNSCVWTQSSFATLTLTHTECVTEPSGLISWWRAEGENHNDDAGRVDAQGRNDCTASIQVDYTGGQVGYAFYFDGGQRKRVIPMGSPSLDIGSNGTGVTIECWVKPGTPSLNAPIFDWASTTSDGLQLWIKNGLQVYADIKDTSGVSHPFASDPGALIPVSFQHVALTYDKASGAAVLYTNGVLAATANWANLTPQTTYDLNIGDTNCPSANHNAIFRGWIDELSIYNRMLTSDEILAIYNASLKGKCTVAPTSSNVIVSPGINAVNEGETASFQVETDCTRPLMYQWYFSNNVNVVPTPVGGNSPVLTLNNLQPAQAGYYFVSVTNTDNIGANSANGGLLYVTNFYTQQGFCPDITISNGNNQAGPMNEFLPGPLVVQVTTNNQPLPNAPLTFSARGGINAVALSTDDPPTTNLYLRTDNYGVATVWYYMPTNASEVNYVDVTVDCGNNKKTVTFTLTADGIATPDISPKGGTFTLMQNAVLTCATPEANIYYTLDGSEPTTTSTAIANGGTIQVCKTMTVKAKAYSSDLVLTSKVQTADFKITGGIASGKNHTLALKADGSLWACGYNKYGQLGDSTVSNREYFVAVSNLTANVIGMAAGDSHSLALSNGCVWAWGYNGYGQLGDGSSTSHSVPNLVPNLTNVTAIAAGANHSLALCNGEVWAWGYNVYGQLGNGTTTNSKTPVQVLSLESVTAIAAGDNFSLAISNGYVWAWGYGNYGQLGFTNCNCSFDYLVRPVVGLSNIVAIAAGSCHALALDAQSNVWAWGYNKYGQLGNNSTTSTNTPVKVKDLAYVTAIAAGDQHSLAISNGQVRAWGYNNEGQLGVGDRFNRTTNVLVPGISHAVAIAAGLEHSAAITSNSNGQVIVWGHHQYGQLGTGEFDYRTTPGQVPGISNAVRIAGGGYHNLVYQNNGSGNESVLAWGRSNYGQLGNGTNVDLANYVSVVGLSNVVLNGSANTIEVAGGYYNSFALSNRTVWAWGYNGSGALGDGTTTTRFTPRPILTNAVAVSAGQNHGLALRTDGTVWAWGDNSCGQLGDGTTTDKHYPVQVKPLNGVTNIAAGYNFNLALSNGYVWAWGANSHGQLGIGNKTNQFRPVQVNLPGTIVAIAAGGSFALALDTQSNVWAWGYNGYGQLGNNSKTDSWLPVPVLNLSNVTCIAAGSAHSLAVLSDGTVRTWGYNDRGQLGIGGTIGGAWKTNMVVNGLSNVIAVAGGDGHSLALTSDKNVWVWGDSFYGQLGNGNIGYNWTPQILDATNIHLIPCGDNP